MADSGDNGREGDWILWSLPAAFLAHDAEEFLTIPNWLAANRDLLSELQRFFGLTMRVPELVGALEIGLAMLALLALFTAATAYAAGRPKSQLALVIYLTLLGAFFIHGFGHIGQAIFLREYTPGVVTAVLVVIPVSLCIYGSLRHSRRVTGALVAGTTLMGTLLIVPGTLLAIWIGQKAASL